MWEILFLTQLPSAVEPTVELGCLPFQGGTSGTEVTLLVFYHYLCIWGQPVLRLHHSYQSCRGLFFYIQSYRGFVQLDFR